MKQASISTIRCLFLSLSVLIIGLASDLSLVAGAVQAANISKATHLRTPSDDVLVYERRGWIWIMDGSGRSPERLFQGSLPSISPDGRYIAFFKPADIQQMPPADTVLWVFGRENKKSNKLVSAGISTSPPSWSKDSSRLAYLSMNTTGTHTVMTLRADGTDVKGIFSEREQGAGFLYSLSFTPDGGLLFHDMRNMYSLNAKGELIEKVSLAEIIGKDLEMTTSSDRIMVCPTDKTLLVFTHSVDGTPLFDKIMHEPNTALFLHDRRLGVGKNFRVTDKEITAFNPVWSPDCKWIYFIGYKDTQAAESDLFRMYRIERFGTNLKELGLGETVGVASSPEAKR
jgi:hypothetical protein